MPVGTCPLQTELLGFPGLTDTMAAQAPDSTEAQALQRLAEAQASYLRTLGVCGRAIEGYADCDRRHPLLAGHASSERLVLETLEHTTRVADPNDWSVEAFQLLELEPNTAAMLAAAASERQDRGLPMPVNRELARQYVQANRWLGQPSIYRERLAARLTLGQHPIVYCKSIEGTSEPLLVPQPGYRPLYIATTTESAQQTVDGSQALGICLSGLAHDVTWSDLSLPSGALHATRDAAQAAAMARQACADRERFRCHCGWGAGPHDAPAVFVLHVETAAFASRPHLQYAMQAPHALEGCVGVVLPKPLSLLELIAASRSATRCRSGADVDMDVWSQAEWVEAPCLLSGSPLCLGGNQVAIVIDSRPGKPSKLPILDLLNKAVVALAVLTDSG